MAAVDVLLPIYNAGPTLLQAIESLQVQTFEDFQLIAIDDGSTDNSADILADLARHDRRITILTTKNCGIVDALNTGIARCTSKYIARQDGDDISDADRFEVEHSYLQEHSDCVAVSGAVRHIDENGRLTGHTSFFTPHDSNPSWLPAREPHISHPFLMVRRAAMNLVGGYRHVYHAEDADLYWRLQRHGRLHSIDRPIGLYRMHSASISSASVANGRIMALSSQLAALSKVRQTAGQNEIDFPKSAMTRYRSATNLEKLVEIGIEGLNVEESAHVRAATCLKLLELATYRPYAIDREDCRYISAITESAETSGENRTANNHLIAKISAVLLRKGLLREALLLTPARRLPSLLWRLAFDCIPRRAQKSLKGFWMKST